MTAQYLSDLQTEGGKLVLTIEAYELKIKNTPSKEAKEIYEILLSEKEARFMEITQIINEHKIKVLCQY